MHWKFTKVLIISSLLMAHSLLAQSSGNTQPKTLKIKAWEILQFRATEKGHEKRLKAIRALGLLTEDPMAMTVAETALMDEKSEVRAVAATALGEMQARGSIPKLKQALNDESSDVVFAATKALRALDDPSAYEVYYAVLMKERKSGDSFTKQQMRVLNDPKKLAKLGFEQGISFLPFADIGYSLLKMATKDDVSPVRAAAAIALANDPDPRSGKALVMSVSDESWVVRVAALNALAKRGDPGLLNSVEPAMSDEKDEVRYTAAAAVLRLMAVQERTGPNLRTQ